MGAFSRKYDSFNKSILKVVSKIPLKDSTFVPQGVCFAEGFYFVTLYDYAKLSNSVIYIFKDGIFVKKVFLDCKVHGGGITYDKTSNSIFLTGKGTKHHSYIHKYDVNTLLSVHNEDIIETIYKYEVDCDNSLYSSSAKHSSPAYINCFDNYLFVGNFCSCSDVDKAIIKKFKILANGELSKSYDVLKNPFSNTQGICLFKYKDEILYLFSRSFGRKRNSLIHICRFVNDKFKIISTMVLPSMLEQVSLADDELVLVFESAAKVYKKEAITINDEIFLISLKAVLESNDNYADFCKGTSFFTKKSQYKF